MKKRTFLFIVLLFASIGLSYAQGVVISGASPTYLVGIPYTFTASVIGGNWDPQGNEVVSSTDYSITVKFANPGMHYISYVVVVNAQYYVDEIEITVLVNPFPPPTVQSATGVTSTSFTANWLGSSSATSYTLEVSTTIYFTTILGTYSSLAGTSYNVTGLNPGTNYYYRVRAFYGSNNSYSGNSPVVTTLPLAPTVSVLYGSVRQSSFTAQWLAIAGATNYVVYVAVGPGYANYVSGYPATISSGGSIMTVPINGLVGETSYKCWVRATNSSGSSADSNPVFVTTTRVAQSPYFKINGDLLPTVNSTVTYTASFHDADGSSLVPPPGTADLFLESAGAGTVISDDGTSITIQWNVIGMAHIEFTYAVSNGNPSYPNSYFEELYFNVGLGLSPPSPILNPYSNPTTTSFRANWQPSTGATSYKLEVSTTNNFQSILRTYSSLTGTSQDVTGLSTSINLYYYRVYALKGSALSPPSSSGGALTVFTAPIANGPTAVTQSTFSASWSPATPGTHSFKLYVAIGPGYTTYAPGYGPATILSANNSTTVTGLNGSTTYKYWVRAANGDVSSTDSNPYTVTTLAPTLPSPTNLSVSNIGPRYFQVNWNAAAGATYYRLEVSRNSAFNPNETSYNNLIVNALNQGVFVTSPSTNFYFRVRSFNTSTSATSAYATYASPVLTTPEQTVATAATNVTSNSFTANWNAVPGATSYTVEVAKTSNFSPLYTSYAGITNTNFNVTGLTDKTTYYYRVNASNSSGSTPGQNYIKAVDLDHNYIRTTDVTVAGNLTVTQVESLSNLNQRVITNNFFDGLGRPEQSVQVQASPMQKDLIQPLAYDKFGREVKTYLPYVDVNEANGSFKENALRESSSSGSEQAQYRTGKQYAFYQTGGVLANDQFPFAETRFEPSPLNRVFEQSAPGSAWQADALDTYTSTDRTIKYAYETNGPNEVILWTYTPSTVTTPMTIVNAGNYYFQNELFKTRTKDEHYNEIIEFKDRQGKVVLKKVQAPGGEWADTYYLYDDFGNLIVVLPPEAVKSLD